MFGGCRNWSLDLLVQGWLSLPLDCHHGPFMLNVRKGFVVVFREIKYNEFFIITNPSSIYSSAAPKPLLSLKEAILSKQCDQTVWSKSSPIFSKSSPKIRPRHFWLNKGTFSPFWHFWATLKVPKCTPKVSKFIK